jgi:hypothetical protein
MAKELIDETPHSNNLINFLLKYNLPLILFSAVITYIGTYYLKLPMDKVLLYNAEDPGYVEPPGVSNPILGIHRFNDFLQVLSYANSPDPFNPTKEYPSMYGPLGLLLVKPLIYIPELVSVILLCLTTSIALYAILKLMTPKLDKTTRVIFSVVFLFMSKPFLLALDRGNIQGIIVALNIAFFYLTWRKKNFLADFLLTISICIKIYPVIFLIYLLKVKEYKRVLRVLIMSATITFISYVIVSRSLDLISFVKGIAKGAAIQSGFPTSGTSASSWLLRWCDAANMISVANGSSPGIRIFQSSVSITLVIILVYSIYRHSLTQQEVCFLLLGYSALISPVSWNYNLIWITFGLIILINREYLIFVRESAFSKNSHRLLDKYVLLIWSFHLLVIPWIWLGSSRIVVSISELTYFPLMIITHVLFVRQGKKSVKMNSCS